MTLKAELETRISRSPAAVFAELMALDRYPQWLIATGVTRVEQLDPGPLDREGIKIAIDASVAAEGTSTVLRWALRADLPLRYRMFEGMVAPQARRAAGLDLEALKRRLESVAQD